MRAIALRNRYVLYTELHRLMQRAVQGLKARPDPRTRQTLEHLTCALIIQGTTRLNQLAHFLLPWRAAKTAHHVETALSTALQKAKYAEGELAHAQSCALYDALPSKAFDTFRRHKIIIIDPTTYEKRTRPGKKGQSMQYPSQLKDLQYDRYPLGYVDVWAGVLLKGRRWLPLARGRFSNSHPDLLSQNQVEEQVLWDAICCVPKGVPILAVGDRGLGRKGMFQWLIDRHCDGLFRLRRDINVTYQGQWCNIWDLARTLKPSGRATWREGTERPVQGSVVFFRAQLTEEDEGGPEISFVVLLPNNAPDPLLLGTTLDVSTLQDACAIIQVYEKRWTVETAFETLKGAFGLEKFMVRQWQAIDRLLNLVAVAFALLLLLMQGIQKNAQVLLAQAVRVLKQQAAFKRLTVGKLREALALDFEQYREAWYALSP